jgi:3-dehydroquinate synthase
MADGDYIQRITVRFEYPVHFTRGVFGPGNPLLAAVLDRLNEGRRHRAVCCVDGGLLTALPQLLEQVKEYFHAHARNLELAGPPMVIPGGETAKNGWQVVRDVIWMLGNLHMDRQSYVVIVGGGGVLDMVGFAASIVHRGLRVVRVPTTTLAQDDAGVGVKNGMDEHGMKNFLGTFAPPFAVINDLAFLASLPRREWLAGVSEAFKVAIIKDAEFLDFLCRSAPLLAARDEAAMEHLVRRTAVIHMEHIAAGGDPFEFGSARPLDFGHWSAHKMEIMTGFALGHGAAVAVGVALDCTYASLQGMITADDQRRIVTALKACGLPTWHECLDQRTPEGDRVVLAGMEEFREHLGGRLTITLPDGIGKKTEVHAMNMDVLEQAIGMLKQQA